MDLARSNQGLNDQDELRWFKNLLIQHGIPCEEPTISEPAPASTQSVSVPAHLTTDTKITLFRRLFRGREDVYPQRWESAKGKTGYSPTCGNEWKPGICHKPRVKCVDCSQRQLLPVTDQLIYNHLAGKQTIGVFPLLADDSLLIIPLIFPF